jgi:diacylglycerol kinase
MNHPPGPHSWMAKFAAAFSGLGYASRTQSSLRVQGVSGVLVVVLACVTGLSPVEWAVLLLAIGLVMGLELVNTSIEAVVDRVSPEYSELARVAKDTAAGAVLVGVMAAVGVGACLFLPHWKRWLGF